MPTCTFYSREALMGTYSQTERSPLYLNPQVLPSAAHQIFSFLVFELVCKLMARHSVIPPSSISLPPKPNLREPPAVSSYLRLDLSRSAAAGLGRCIGGSTDDTEIGIFDAKRYFSEDHDTGRCDLYRRDSSSSSDGYPKHGLSFSFNSTPTASSEASWNSQSGLLTNPSSGSLPVSADALSLKDPSKSPSSASRRRLFRGNCPCYGKKSVQVEEKCSEPLRGEELGISSTLKRRTIEEIENDEVIKAKISSGSDNFLSSSNRFSPDVGSRMVDSCSPFRDSGGFSFPILTPPTVNFAQKPARKSLEVFRPTNWSAYSLSTLPESQRRTAVFPFSGEVDRQSFSFPVFSKPPPDDDVASDTSSDLFEIESFSTQTTQLRRNSLDKIQRDVGGDTPPRVSVAPSDCYTPSEASIDWSVFTAEGFDRASLANFSSAASDFGKLRFTQGERERYAAVASGGRRRRGSLLVCRNEKAVSVVGPSPVCLRPDHIRAGVNRPLRAG